VDSSDTWVIDTWVEGSTTCTDGVCAFVPGSDIVLAGLTNGTYQWWMRSWTDTVFSTWSDPVSFTVAVATPTAPVGLSVQVVNGQPIFTWAHNPDTSTYYRLYVGINEGSKLYDEWHTLSEMNCNGSTCSFAPAVTLPAGDLTWYVKAWGPGGTSADGIDGWNQGPLFRR